MSDETISLCRQIDNLVTECSILSIHSRPESGVVLRQRTVKRSATWPARDLAPESRPVASSCCRVHRARCARAVGHVRVVEARSRHPSHLHITQTRHGSSPYTAPVVTLHHPRQAAMTAEVLAGCAPCRDRPATGRELLLAEITAAPPSSPPAWAPWKRAPPRPAHPRARLGHAGSHVGCVGAHNGRGVTL